LEHTSKRVLLLDSTLREGEQAPGVSFSVKEKIEIAKKLDEIGIDIIEAGNPKVSKDVKEAVKNIAELGLRAEIIGHARAIKSDIDEVIDCDTDGIGIFLGTTDVRLRDQLRKTPQEAVQLAVEAVEYAKAHGLKIRFTPEDATRTTYDFLIEISRATIAAGADRISLADTVGILTPERARNMFGRLTKELTVDLETHCHNDLGLAVANSLASMEGGAKIIDVTVNGIGERSGIASLQEIATALKIHYGIDTVNLSELPELSKIVEKYSGIALSPHTPIVGDNAFTHKAGVHTAAVLVNPTIYEGFPPELVGKKRDIILDKYAGRHALKARLDKLGISLSEDQLLAMLVAIKERPTITNFRDADLIELAESITGMKFQANVPEAIEATMLIKCESNVYTSSIARKVRVVRGVRKVYEISGDYDIEVFIVAASTPELNNSLEKIRESEGVVATNTRLIFKKFDS